VTLRRLAGWPRRQWRYWRALARWRRSEPLVPPLHNLLNAVAIDETSYQVMRERWAAAKPRPGDFAP
jgi:hypothetical protein